MPELAQLIDALPCQPIRQVGQFFAGQSAAEALAQVVPSAAEAIPALLRALQVRISIDSAVVLRLALAKALWKIGRRSDVALPVLGEALQDEHWGAAREAVEVLADMGQEARQAIPALLALLDRRLSSEPSYFEEIEAFNAATYGTARPRPFLGSIALALGNCDNGTEAVLQALRHLGQHEDAEVRSSAAVALAKIGPSASD